jgi:glucose/arabinose dehydrogenase
MTLPVRSRPPLLVTILLTGLAMAACSSSSSSQGGTSSSSAAATGSSAKSSASAPTPAPSGSSSGGHGGSVSDGLGHPVNVCQLLPVATVASVSGENLTQAKEDDTLSYKIYACDYSNAAGTDGVDVSVLAQDAAPGYDGALSAAGFGAKQISGLGDKAFSSILGLQALFGNVSITVSNLPSDQASATLIRDLQPKL